MQKPTSPLWYVAALFIALGSWVIATVVAAGAWEPVREAVVTQAGPAIDGKERSVAVFTDLVQPERDVACQLLGPGDKKTQVKPASIDITVTTDGTPWTLLGMVSKGRNGTRLRCTPDDKRVDDAEYGFAVVEGFQSKANTGQGIAMLGTLAGLGLAGYTFHSRRQRKGSS